MFHYPDHTCKFSRFGDNRLIFPRVPSPPQGEFFHYLSQDKNGIRRNLDVVSGVSRKDRGEESRLRVGIPGPKIYLAIGGAGGGTAASGWCMVGAGTGDSAKEWGHAAILLY